MSCSLLQPCTARTVECVTTIFVMEQIIRRTIRIVQERVGGKLVNTKMSEVSSAVTGIVSISTVIFLVVFYIKMFFYWATICKMVCSMLSDHCPAVCLYVMLVCCGQTVRWISVKLGMEMEIGLDPGHIVLDGDPAPLPNGAMSVVAKRSPISAATELSFAIIQMCCYR